MKKLDKQSQIQPFSAGVTRLVDDFLQENSDYRLSRMLDWRKKDLYWKGIQYLFETGDYTGLSSLITTPEDEQAITRIINIYKAHGESIIAAITTAVPAVRFFPADAENTNDIETSKGWTNSWELIKKRNNLNLLFVKLVWILFQQDFAACYNYNTDTKKYGVIKQDKTKDMSMDMPMHTCPQCEARVSEEDVKCAECGSDIIPVKGMENKKVSQFVGTEEIAKTSEFLKVYGPMNINIPFWATCPEDLNHLILDEENHVANLKHKYPNFKSVIAESLKTTNEEEKWARTAHGAQLSVDKLVTERQVWLLPQAYTLLPEDEEKLFTRFFPNGMKVVILGNDLVVSICEENLHERWTLTRSPLSRHLHADSLGNSLPDVQDVTNDLVNLTIQTIEGGISETFVDPEILDFDEYSKNPSRPGQVTPIKVPPGISASQFFHSTKPATLSREVKDFETGLMNYGQFASGAFPSIYGGNIKGSRTVGEYEKSRAGALQRLAIHFSMLKTFMVELAEKSTKSFTSNLKADEIDVTQNEGAFVNNFIIRSNLVGSVGKIEAEVSESFPVTWQDKASRLLELFQLGNETINAAVMTPENTTLLKNMIGIPELVIDGEDSRNKQWSEIYELVQAGPISEMQSSVPVDEFDAHEVEFRICVLFINSDRGQTLKHTNKNAYMNVMLHAKEHKLKLMELANGGQRPGNSGREQQQPSGNEGSGS